MKQWQQRGIGAPRCNIQGDPLRITGLSRSMKQWQQRGIGVPRCNIQGDPLRITGLILRSIYETVAAAWNRGSPLQSRATPSVSLVLSLGRSMKQWQQPGIGVPRCNIQGDPLRITGLILRSIYETVAAAWNGGSPLQYPGRPPPYHWSNP